VGEIAVEKPAEDNILSGVLLKKNFSYHIFAAEDIPSTFYNIQLLVNYDLIIILIFFLYSRIF